MRLTLKAINEELAKRGYTARLAKSAGYFYFQFGEAASWLDRTVNVPTVSSLTLAEWMAEFELLRKLNGTSIAEPPPSVCIAPDLVDSHSSSNSAVTREMPACGSLRDMPTPRRKRNKSRR